MSENLENSVVAIGLEKVRFHSSSKEEQCQRTPSFHIISLITHASKVLLKILQARLQQYEKWELSYVQAEFRKDRESRSNCQYLLDVRNRREFHKYMYFCFIDYAKSFDSVDYNILGKILKDMGIPDYLTYLLRNLYVVKKQLLELNME